MKLQSALLYENEQPFHQKYSFVAGVDEAGRGPLAGPAVVAAVILPTGLFIDGVNDSKQITAALREILAIQIKIQAIAYAIIEVPVGRIDEINILQAVLEGMKLAVEKLAVLPGICLIDGNKLPACMAIPALACVEGDATYASIAAASILAKVHRDNLMRQYDVEFPEYGFASHKGYPTPQHLAALQKHGPCPIHRVTYGPVREALNNEY